MSLFSGFGKKNAPQQAEEKKPQAPQQEVKEPAGGEKKEPVHEEKKEPVHEETEFLLAKTTHCPVCDASFHARTVKSGRARRLPPDFDLRPRFFGIDTNKYDVVSCPYCGYTAMNRYFGALSGGQIKLVRQEVCSKFKKDASASDETLAAYTYEEAISRYQLAIRCTEVKKGKMSEIAYEHLKISWLYRGLLEKLAASDEKDDEAVQKAQKLEMEYYNQAYEEFVKAIASEDFPMCGMDESTMNLLLASMACRIGKYDVAAKLVSTILTSHVASYSVKDRARDLKEEILMKRQEAK